MEDEWGRFDEMIVKPAVAETVPSMARMAFVVGYNAALLSLCENPDAAANVDVFDVAPAFDEEAAKWRARLDAFRAAGKEGGAA